MNHSGPSGQPREVLLNVDLLGLTPVFITQLDRLRPFFQHATEEILVRRLIHRYENLWLPLLAKWQQLDLEPPSDIHWIWHLHLLQPKLYVTYCRERFNRVLPHRIRKYDRESASALQRTASLWQDTYPGVPFEADLVHLRSDDGAKMTETKLDDLVAVAANERELIHQIGLPHHRDQSFQYAAVERYRRLLQFRARRPSENLRIPVDVQLVWRVHLLHPIQFAEDTRRIFGYPMYDLGDMDFEAHSILLVESDNAWREEFGEELFIEGTGYRSLETTGRAIHPFPRDCYDRRTIESCEISIGDLTVDEIWTKEKKVVVKALLIGDNSFAQQTLFRTSGTVGTAMCGGQGSGSAKASGGGDPLGRTHFDTRRNKGLEFQVIGRKGVGCLSQEHIVATKLFNPVAYFENLESLSANAVQRIVLPKVTYTDPKISFEMTVRAEASKPHAFTLDRNPSEQTHLPPDLSQFVSTSQSWNVALTTPAGNSFQTARHSLKCREAGLAFGVEVIKHEVSDIGAVLLYHNNQRLVTVAYSVDGSELPSRIQVLETCPVSLEPQDGDHAMLIRNHLGDYAVCIARWQSSSTGDGRFVISTYYFQSRTTQTLEIRDDELQSIKTDIVTIDLPTGRLSVDSACEWLPEQITWAFCVGTLYVISQKTSLSGTGSHPSSLLAGSVRSVQWSSTSDPDVDSIGNSATSSAKKSKSSSSSSGGGGGGGGKAHAICQKKLAKRRKMSASFTFLLACGLQIDTTLYGSSSKPASRGSPAAGHHRSHPNIGTNESSLSADDVTFVRTGPTNQPSSGVTQYTPSGLKNANPGVYSFPQTIAASSSLRDSRHSGGHVYNSASLQHHSNRLVAPPAHDGIAGRYIDVRL